MIITKSSTPIEWKTLDPAGFQEFHDDWYHNTLKKKICFSLDLDTTHLWFTTIHNKKPHTHPEAKAGEHTTQLWKYDLAELFISNAERNKYVEFNLAANGAWWSAEFCKPRVLGGRRDYPFPGIQTFHEYLPGTGWAASMSIPLHALQSTLEFCQKSGAMVSSITNYPMQQFQCSSRLMGAHPDFHQPKFFDRLKIIPCPH